MAYQQNPGHLPPACEVRDDNGHVTGFRNVHIRTFGGFCTRKAGHAPWPSLGTRQPHTNWKISKPPHRFEIEFWEVA